MATGGESIPRVYTRTGDHGTTGLSGGSRVDKDSDRIRAYGSYDELGAQLGATLSDLPGELAVLRPVLERLRHEFFVAQAELAVPMARSPRRRIGAAHVERMERDIDRFQAELPPLHSFVLPGGSHPAAQLHICRTIARRAETELLRLHRSEPVSPELRAWANRLSDLLFVCALVANRRLGVREIPPDYSI